MRKSVIFWTFFSIAGFLFSQAEMQLLKSIDSPFVDDGYGLGIIIKGGGDINGDGCNDIVLAGQSLGSIDGRREVYVYLRGSTINTEPDYIIPDPSDPVLADLNNYFGWVIAYNGDLNGDGTNPYFELYVKKSSACLYSTVCVV